MWIAIIVPGNTSIMNTTDQNQRDQALDPTQSFIVQAPAGSGKTELLTQRFLVLLSNVKQPEEILAITFTKKSAAEMRARIVKALNRAQDSNEPASAHDKRTWDYARRVLKQDQALAWNLLANPNRLQIQTIDSFNSRLTRQLPLLSHFGGPIEIADDPNQLYQAAVNDLLLHLHEQTHWSKSIATLLLHLDNDLNQGEKLIIAMLAKRDQWLPTIASNRSNPELRAILESNLAQVNINCIANLNNSIPMKEELFQLIRFAATNVPENHCLYFFNELNTFPGTTLNDKPYWMAIANLLLTNEMEWRKRLDKNLGFPPTEKHSKQQMLDYIEALSQNEKLKNAFEDLLTLPAVTYNENQWEVLDALHDVLRLAAAQLTVVFRQYGKIDYIENAQAALRALGDEDNPTDIALAFDYKIQHILVDEFQDTSVSQFHLLKKLTASWQPDESRTLFLVGDPMQSIYRFREAEVGLFMLTQQQGLGQIKLKPLTLQANFRSSPVVIDWINQHFPYVFTKEADPSTGAVCFSPSIAARNTEEYHSVQLKPLFNTSAADQANEIVSIIQTNRATHQKAKIAILVRSRSHLTAILPALKNAGLKFKAVDIDPLNARALIQDLIILTRALHSLSDRLAWLSLLRAPWCGLLLADLLVISKDPSALIWHQLNNKKLINNISVDGQKRLQRILPHLAIALAERRRYPLREWIEQTWIHIGGPACIAQESDLEDANTFFNLLESLDEGYCLQNVDYLNEALDKLFASPDNSADDLLQVMTIHNAKGLEFDSVILPHLERTPSHDSAQLLQWLEQPDQGLLLAPIVGAGDSHNEIYDYIKRQHAIKADHENSRLLYVAATRAKNQLYLLFNLKSDENNNVSPPPANSLLNKLWNTIGSDIDTNVTIKPSLQEKTHETLAFKRLHSEWHPPLIQNKLAAQVSDHQNKPGFNLIDPTPAIIGTVIHKIFEVMTLTAARGRELQTHIRNLLIQQGLPEQHLNNSCKVVMKAIDNTLQDKRGQWILKSYQNMTNEMPLTAIINGQIKHLIIDRTFVDEQGVRWIVDYKSSTCTDGKIDQFLQKEKDKYQQQLQEYAEAFSAFETRPLRLGLYFPLIPIWSEL